MKVKRAGIVTLLIIAMLAAVLVSGCSQNSQPKPQEEYKFPTRTINIIVPWPPGGRTDTWIRALAVQLEKDLGVPVVVSNHSGGAGVIGARAVAAAAPDGYTLGPFTVAHMIAELVKDPPFNADLYAPVAGFTSIPYGIAVNANSPWQTLEEYLADAKANPGKMKHGNTGTGVEDHIFSEDIYNRLGIEVKQVPYQGDAPAVTALLANEIDIAMMGIAPLLPHLKSGTLRVLAVSSAERYPFAPDIPTFVEQGVDFKETTWTGIFVPKGTPQAAIDRLRQAVEAAVKDPDFKQVMDGLNSPIRYYDTAQLTEQLNITRTKLKDLIDDLESRGLKLRP